MQGFLPTVQLFFSSFHGVMWVVWAYSLNEFLTSKGNHNFLLLCMLKSKH